MNYINRVENNVYYLQKRKFNKIKKQTFLNAITLKMLKKCCDKKKKLPPSIMQFNTKRLVMKSKKQKVILRSQDRDFKNMDPIVHFCIAKPNYYYVCFDYNYNNNCYY